MNSNNMIDLVTGFVTDPGFVSDVVDFILDEETEKKIISGLLVIGLAYLNDLTPEKVEQIIEIVFDAKSGNNTYNLSQDEIDGAYKLLLNK